VSVHQPNISITYLTHRVRQARTHSIKKHNPNRVLRPNDNFLLLDLHSGFEGGVEVGGLQVFVGGVVVESLHGGGTVYAEEDHVALGVEKLDRCD
jgi:hypothetical protein